MGITIDRKTVLTNGEIIFENMYSSLNNEDFVKALYTNILGRTGEESGIKHWAGMLDSGTFRGDMLSKFVTSSLDLDLDNLFASNLISADLFAQAKDSQDMLINKSATALYYSLYLGDSKTAAASASMEDMGYATSVNVLYDIDSDISSATEKMAVIESLGQNQNTSLSDVYNSFTIL